MVCWVNKAHVTAVCYGLSLNEWEGKEMSDDMIDDELHA